MTHGQQTQVTQSGNEVGGDIVAGNKVTNIHYADSSSSRAFVELVEKLRKEINDDAKVDEIIPELKRFQEPKNSLDRSLEQKLEEGNMADLIVFALLAKEAFTKKMVKFTLFESAQDIHVFFLSRIYSIFNIQIKPLLSQGIDRDQIERRIRDLIVEPIAEELRIPPLRYYDEEVYGMIYLLAEKCHINWDKK